MILPKVEKEIIKKYISELEKARNEYVYQNEKEKVCPLYPLVAFPKMKDVHKNSEHSKNNLHVDQQALNDDLSN